MTIMFNIEPTRRFRRETLTFQCLRDALTSSLFIRRFYLSLFLVRTYAKEHEKHTTEVREKEETMNFDFN